MSEDANLQQRTLRDVLNDGESFDPEQAVRMSILSCRKLCTGSIRKERSLVRSIRTRF